MAIRLPVVLSQHPRKSGVFSECEEAWITSLLFEERLDATLVAHLGSIERDSTDHLCLEGLKGDFVLVSWETGSFVLEHLQRLGLGELEIVPVDGSPKLTGNASGSHAKKVYLMGYRPDEDVKHSISRLKQLLESRATPVFQLQISPARTTVARSEANPAPTIVSLPIVELPRQSSAPSDPVVIRGTTSRGNSTFGNAPAGVSASGIEMETKDDDDFPNIDLLVDELDRFDS